MYCTQATKAQISYDMTVSYSSYDRLVSLSSIMNLAFWVSPNFLIF